MSIKYLDMFSGIGGFRSGLEKVGGFKCVGYCEIDEYARRAYEALYDTKGEMCFENARTINPDMLPDVDVICGGFPCQSFSIAGKRRGFDDIRGTLFFEIARIAAVKKPALLFLENVPGLLSHDKGWTFATILSTLDNIGYDVWWQVCNSANFGVPQSRNACTLSDITERNVKAKYCLSTKQILKLLSGDCQAVKVEEYTPTKLSE